MCVSLNVDKCIQFAMKHSETVCKSENVKCIERMMKVK